MKYSAINIGPIIRTLGMARKPRELWAASYMFSHLMKCIYNEAEKMGGNIISPARPNLEKCKAGIYPDRIYLSGDLDLKQVMSNALCTFYLDLTGEGKKKPDLNYFNVMAVTCKADCDSDAIGKLNQKLDVMELCNYASDDDASKTIYSIISDKGKSPLFKLATGEDRMKSKELKEIANAQNVKDTDMKSYHKYFCVVQADGDNVGKTISNAKGNVKAISKALTHFGENATQKIEEYGGMPIYAGGDDLLFIAPVVGKDGCHVFKLLETIESESFKKVREAVQEVGLKADDGNPLEASLSFGVSISYYKHPLYEALEAARSLLFDVAKKTDKKNAIAWSLRKHSGGTFDAVFSRANADLWHDFMCLVNATTDDEVVSAVAHKIRENQPLVNIVLESDVEGRLDALFDKILEFDKKKENYFNAVKNLMPKLYQVVGKEKFTQSLYCLLRTAKFIKGEELRDE